MSDDSNIASAAEEMAASLEASLGGDDGPEAPNLNDDFGGFGGGGGGGEGGGQGGGSDSHDDQGKSSSGDRNIDLIMDIPLKVTVELGRTKMVVRELLNLGQGSVIELNKLAGEPMEILVNDKLVARGEAVVVNEKFGVRLTDIISPLERVEQLK